MTLLLSAPLCAVAITFIACGGGGDTATAPSTVIAPAASTTPTTSTGGTTATTTALAYNQDIKPILDSDCVICHGPNIHENNVRLDSYANVMRVVTPGSSSSLIVRETRPGAAQNR